MRVKVLLEVSIEDVPERELGDMDVNLVGRDVAQYADDLLGERTRKEFDEPWRVISVTLAR